MKDNNKRNIMEFWTRKRIPYVFDETLSLYQLVRLTVKYLNEVIKDQNELKDAIKEFIEMFDEDLEDTVIEVLEKWKGDGSLKEIINEALFESKLDKTVFNKYVNDQKQVDLKQDTAINKKADKVDLNNLKSEIDKERKITEPLADPNVKLRIIGDSIAKGVGSSYKNGFVKPLKDMYPNLNVDTYGVGSASLAKIPSRPWVYDQLDQVESDTTHLVIHAGINDVTSTYNDRKWYIGYPQDPFLGYDSGNESSILALAKMIEALRIKNSKMKIFFVISGSSNIWADFIKDTALDFIQTVAYKYSVNVVDMRKIMPEKYSPYYSQYNVDGVHPNDRGYKLQAEYLAMYINNGLSDGKSEYPNLYFTTESLGSNTSLVGQMNDLKTVVGEVVKYSKYVDVGTVKVISLQALVQQWVVEFGSVASNVRGIAYKNEGNFKNRRVFSFSANKLDDKSKDMEDFEFSYENKVVPVLNDYTSGYTSLSTFSTEGTYVLRNSDLKKISDMPTDIKSLNGDIVEIIVLSNTGVNAKFIVSVGLQIFLVYKEGSKVTHKEM